MEKYKTIFNNTRIDRREQLGNIQPTSIDLRAHYGTGVALTKGTGWNKTHTYRNGVGTNIGDIERSLWQELVLELVQRNDEEKLFGWLIEWTAKERPERSKEDLKQFTLELYAARIFDDPIWVDFIPFNQQYRPGILDKANLIRVFFLCCKKEGIVTQERLAYDTNNRTYCPNCGRWGEYRMLEDNVGK